MSQAPLLKPEIPSGTLIDRRYIIHSLLGQGGLGRTYLALDTRRFNEPCVLKEFAPIGTERSELQKCHSLFKREAKILYQFEHIQIPRFLACFEAGERLFLVQEFVDGKAYSTLLRERQKQRNTFTEQEVIQWLKNLLPVLEYVHSHDIIHRDISPDNIMLPKGKILPVLIDFGVGKQIANIGDIGNSSQESLVGKISLVGKMGYSPREQISLGLCFPSSDIYALGVTAIVLLTGKDPSFLIDPYTLEWKWRFYTNVSEDFAQILDRMLAEIYTNRYQTSQELLMDLESLVTTQIATSNVEAEGKYQIRATNFNNVEGLPSASSLLENMMEYPEGLAPTILETSSGSQFIANSSHSHDDPEAVFSSPVSRKTSQNQQHASITAALIQRCKEELAYYIGPMASLIVEDALVENPHLVPYQFVEVLSREIPDLQEASKFIRDLIGLVSRP